MPILSSNKQRHSIEGILLLLNMSRLTSVRLFDFLYGWHTNRQIGGQTNVQTLPLYPPALQCECCCCCVLEPRCHSEMNASEQTFTTPNYPHKYFSNYDCHWLIHTAPGTSLVLFVLGIYALQFPLWVDELIAERMQWVIVCHPTAKFRSGRPTR